MKMLISFCGLYISTELNLKKKKIIRNKKIHLYIIVFINELSINLNAY